MIYFIVYIVHTFSLSLSIQFEIKKHFAPNANANHFVIFYPCCFRVCVFVCFLYCCCFFFFFFLALTNAIAFAAQLWTDRKTWLFCLQSSSSGRSTDDGNSNKLLMLTKTLAIILLQKCAYVCLYIVQAYCLCSICVCVCLNECRICYHTIQKLVNIALH